MSTLKDGYRHKIFKDEETKLWNVEITKFKDDVKIEDIGTLANFENEVEVEAALFGFYQGLIYMGELQP